MTKWEYRAVIAAKECKGALSNIKWTVVLDDGRDIDLWPDLVGVMNKLGSDGWELVSVDVDIDAIFANPRYSQTVEKIYWFKRPVQSP